MRFLGGNRIYSLKLKRYDEDAYNGDIMEYLITFLEGFISFLSPCMLPMLPLYISYFAGAAKRKKAIKKLSRAWAN